MADQQTSSFSSRTSKSASGNVVETIDLVKEYAKQEALGPLRGAGRWVAFGLIGALSMAGGVLLVVLGGCGGRGSQAPRPSRAEADEQHQ